MNAPAFKMLPKIDRDSDLKIAYEGSKLIRCKECRHGKHDYNLAGYVICNNRYSPCHTSVVEDDFYCAKGEPKEGEPE